MPCRELRFVLSVVFYVVNKNPQNRIRSKSCRNQKKTPEIRRFQVLFCLVLTEKIPSKMRDKISFHLLFQKLLCGNMRQFSIAKQRMSRYLVQ